MKRKQLRRSLWEMELSRSTPRGRLFSYLTNAAQVRRNTMRGYFVGGYSVSLARDYLSLAHREQQPASFWQPLP